MEMWSEVIVTVLATFVAVVTPILAREVIGWIKSKKLYEMVKTEQEWADLAVRFAADAYKLANGEVRYNQACIWLSDRLKERGFKLKAEEIDGLVRSAYQAIYGEWIDAKE